MESTTRSGGVTYEDLKPGLDWLKQVAGLEDDYIRRWSASDWAAWATAMGTDRNAPNPCVPDWMQPIIQGKWWWDFSLPFPQVGQLLPTAHNWFLEADRRSDFSISVDEPAEGENPDLAALRAAWEEAVSIGATPLINMDLAPDTAGGPRHVTGAVASFYIVYAPKLESEVNNLAAALMPNPGSNYQPFHLDAIGLLTEAEVPVPNEPLTFRGWDWLYA